jgi:rfaE bifunctional protein kinase chain/domain
MENQILGSMEQIDPQVNAWLISDYNYLPMTARIAERLAQMTREKPLVVDSRYRSRLFKGARCMTPNELEAVEIAGLSQDEKMDIESVGLRILDELEAESLVITRGNQGMVVFERSGILEHVPAVGEEEAVDVNGAGDTVAAALTAALVCGATTLDAARLASCAASVVVMKTGAATCRPEELMARLAFL